MVYTSIYKKLLTLRWLGIDKDTWTRDAGKKYSWRYSVDELGFKYHMNDITAVIGLAQLEVLDEHNKIRRKIAARYDGAFKGVSWITTPVEKPYAFSSRHNYVIKITQRDALNEYLSSKGISTGVHYEPVNYFKVFKNAKISLPVTDKVWKEILTLPLYPGMAEKDFKKITKEILRFGKINRL